jgi:hypothetical protein
VVARYRPSLAKNMIRRSLHGIIDPHPTDVEVDRLWQYFDARCAFCDRKVGITPKDAHVDHLEAGEGGGANHVSNRVLACADCNEKEKRQIPWRDFLRRKANSLEEYAEREARIEEWLRLTRTDRHRVSDDILRQAENEIDAVVQSYDEALIRIRALRDKPD